jgi:hypothetical protein
MIDKKFLKKVTETFGIVYQREMMIEECSELIIAMADWEELSGFGRNRNISMITSFGRRTHEGYKINFGNKEVKRVWLNFIEEYVDVEIILTELKTAIDENAYNKVMNSKVVQDFKKFATEKYSFQDYRVRSVNDRLTMLGNTEIMTIKCCELIKSIQKVKRLEQKIGFVDDYKNKTNADAKKSTNNYMEKLACVEVMLNVMRCSVYKPFYNKSLKYKITRLKKRLTDKIKENTKKVKPIGRPKAKNWDDPLNAPIKVRNYKK